MKIIFLDMDGVLCTFRSHCAQLPQHGMMSALDREGVGLLNVIAEYGDEAVRYVLSSTWRKCGERGNLNWMVEHLRAFGWRGDFHDDWRTISLPSGVRGEEIAEWLSRHPDISEYLILDDDGDMLAEQMPRFVLTHGYDGISFKNFLAASEILHNTKTPWMATSTPESGDERCYLSTARDRAAPAIARTNRSAGTPPARRPARK